MNVLLIGARACGKTTIGRLMAARLNLAFVDLDVLTLASFSERSIAQVWAAHGEQAWREAEAKSLEKALQRNQQIIALGGGTPMVAEARKRIDEGRGDGTLLVIYLRCDPVVLADRLRQAPGDRPSLSGEDVAEEVAAVLARRESTYLAIADAVVNASGDDPEKLADHVTQLVRNHGFVRD